MKSKKFYKENIVTFIICLFLNIHLIISQTNDLNLQKYWHYRYRLTHYFMVVGDGTGESLPADIRNFQNGDILKWSETPVQLGYYLGVLATEYHLLKINNQNTDQTLTELYYALNAITRLDLAADGVINGYLLEDDIDPNDEDPNSFLNTANHKDLLNYNITQPDPYVPHSGEVCKIGHVASDLSPCSQDELFHLLMGLALVNKYVDNGNAGSNFKNYITGVDYFYYRFEVIARNQADLIVSYMKDSPFKSNTYWQLLKSDGSNLSNGNGGNATAFSYGIAKAGEFITGRDYTDHSWPSLWQLFKSVQLYRENFSNTTLSSILAAIGDSWTDGEGHNTTKEGILFNGNYGASLLWDENYHGNELFYGAIHRLLHGYYLGDDPAFDMCKMKSILNMAPGEGSGDAPFCHSANDLASYGGVDGGWAASRRFYNAPPDQEIGQTTPTDDFEGNYSGLDYMLFHNLYYCLQEGDYNISKFMPEFDQFQGIKYFTAAPYELSIPYRKIIIQNTIISNNASLYGAAIITGGPQGVELNNIVEVDEGAELTISTTDGCSVDPVDYIFNSSYYKHFIPNNNIQNDTLPSYKMIPEAELLKSSSLIISPSPNNGIFQITVTKNNQAIGVKDVKVYDMVGRVIWENNTPSGNTFNVDISNYAPGIYYVRALNEAGDIDLKKLIKE